MEQYFEKQEEIVKKISEINLPTELYYTGKLI